MDNTTISSQCENPDSPTIIKDAPITRHMCVKNSYKYGGTNGSESKKSRKIEVGLVTLKADLLSFNCILRMANIFVQMKDEYLVLYRKILRIMLNERKYAWCWREMGTYYNQNDVV